MNIPRSWMTLVLSLLLLDSAPSYALSITDFSVFGLGLVTIGGGSTVNSGLVGSGTQVTLAGASTVKQDIYVDSGGTGGKVVANNGVKVDGNIRATGRVSLGANNIIGGTIGAGDKVGFGNTALSTANFTTVVGTVTHPTGTTISTPNSTIGGNIIGTPQPAAPFLPSLPGATLFSSGGTSYTGLGNGFDLTLAPSTSYGAIQGGGNGKLQLSAGNYFFDSISTGNGTDLILDLAGGPIKIYVTDKASFGSVDVILKNNVGDASLIYLEAHGTGDNVFKAGGGSDWLGTAFTPNGDIHFGGSGCCSTFTGYFWAGIEVDIEHSVTGNLPPTQAPEPASLLLVSSGLAGLVAWRWRRARA